MNEADEAVKNRNHYIPKNQLSSETGVRTAESLTVREDYAAMSTGIQLRDDSGESSHFYFDHAVDPHYCTTMIFVRFAAKYELDFHIGHCTQLYSLDGKMSLSLRAQRQYIVELSV
uniref:Uncharacterized protein n=1 Tax=Schizaphis graminum TaxID=13262 RepID=A0A2S2NEP5_SCHGA